MVVTDHLFQLIKALNKSEKGYFKKYAHLHVRAEDNNYIKVFDEIEKQSVYDEAKILKKFSGEKFTKNFSVAKNYLYNSVLRSLTAYYRNDIKSEIRNMLGQIEILFNKGLLKQTEKLIFKSKELANSYELFTYLVEILQWEKKYMSFTAASNRDFDIIEELNKEIIQLSVLISVSNYYQSKSSELSIFTSKVGFIKNATDEERLEAIMDHELLINPLLYDKITTSYHYFNIQCSYFFLKNDLKRAYDYANEAYKLFERQQEYKDFCINDYTGTLITKLNISTLLREKAKVWQTLDQLRKIKNILFDLKNPKFYNVCNYMSNAGLDFCEFDVVEIGVQEFQECIENHENFKPDKQQEYLFYFNGGYLNFVKENYSEANKFFQKILNDNKKEIRHDLHRYARILSLLIQGELKNFNFMEYQYKNTKRFLEKEGNMNSYEKAILAFVKKHIIPSGASGIPRKAFQDLRAKLVEIQESNTDNMFLKDIDIIAWVDSKIHGKPMKDIMKSKCAQY